MSTVKWELWRRHRRDGRPDEKLQEGESVSISQAYKAIRVAEMDYPIGWCPELNYIIREGQNIEEGGGTPYPVDEYVRNS